MDHIETKILNSYPFRKQLKTWYSQQGLPNRGIPFKRSTLMSLLWKRFPIENID